MTGTVTTLPVEHRLAPPRDERDWVLSTELITEAGITYRQLDYWSRTGLLTPLTAAAPGSGFVRRFHESQVPRAQTLAALLDAGISLQLCRRVIDDVLTSGHVDLGPFTLTRSANPQAKEAHTA